MKTSLLLIAVFCGIFKSSQGSDLVKCEKTYQKIGCFEEYNPKNLLLSERFNIRWGNIEAFMHHLTCICVAKAREENKARSPETAFKGIALHYWGVCYGKTQADLEQLKTKSESHKCTGSQEYSGCKKEHSHCVGHAYADYVYKLIEAATETDVNGGYSDWEAWTSCRGECGVGIKLRERTCTNPEPKGKGKDCTELGPSTERAQCDTGIKCPIDGGFSAWSAYGACSQTCGGGNQTRSRLCDNPAPAHGGKNCEGALTETAPCKNDLCPGPDGVSKAQDLVRDFLIGFHNTSYPEKTPSGKFHQAILAIQRAVANEFALGTTSKNLQERLDDLKKFLKVATAGGSIDFARAALGKGLFVFMKKKIEEGLPIDKLNEASNGYLDSIKREIGDDKFRQLMLVDGAASLIFTVDTTGSMRDEINAAKGIANSIINMERKFPVDYVLSPFNDPSVGPVTHKNESNKNEFISAIQSLSVRGGGDCPELAFGGMVDAFNANPKLGSPMFVFTDAGAKDDTFEMKEGLKTLADQYGTTINFFTNYRGCGDAKAIKSYQEIAAYTSGQIFPLQSHSEITKFTSFVKSSLEGGTTIAKNTYTTSKKRSVATEGFFFVENGIETLLISLNVKNANTAASVKLLDDTGKVYSAQSTTSYSQVYTIDNPAAGRWQLQFPSNAGERSYIAKGIAKEAVDFAPYFVHQEREGGPILSVSHPLQGDKVTLMIQLTGNGLVDHKSLIIAITNEKGNVLGADIPLKSVGGSAGIFQADISPPSGKFKFLLKGTTTAAKQFQRVSHASFEATDTVMATINAGNEFTASASKASIKVNLYMYNKAASQSYRFVATSSHGSVTADSGSVMVQGAKNSTASFTFNLPGNARSLVGKTTNVAITATGQTSGKKVQAAFALLFVP